MDNQITGNKGEWSEIYVLLKLLADGKLFPGDKNIKKIPNLFYPIEKIIRTESNGKFEYSTSKTEIVISGGSEIIRIPLSEFDNQSKILLKNMKETSNRSFAVPTVQTFMDRINCKSLKANSSQKTDITIVIHDSVTMQSQNLGFSIKSQIGSPSTLLNAGKTTNFTYKIINENLSDEDIDRINRLKRIKEKLDEINRLGGTLEFKSIDNQVFSNNLVLIDSMLPAILSHLLIEFYNSKNTTTIDLIESVARDNPLDYDLTDNHKYYSYKIKRFLTDVALGMMPSQVWSGYYDATGGYLIVKETGDIVCYHVYNKNELEEYLLNNTKLETASTTRHKFGKIFREDDKLYFKLNLQIRFKK